MFRLGGKYVAFLSHSYRVDRQFAAFWAMQIFAKSKLGRFENCSPEYNTTFDIDEEDGLKSVLDGLIKSSDAFVTYAQRSTLNAPWLEWELTRAARHGIPIVAIKPPRAQRIPPLFRDAGQVTLVDFDVEKVQREIKRAGDALSWPKQLRNGRLRAEAFRAAREIAN